MLLSWHGRAALIGDFNAELGTVRVFPRPPSVPFGETAGWFSFLDDVCVVLYVDDDGLFRLRIGAEEVIVQDSVDVEWARHEQHSMLVIKSDQMSSKVVYSSAPPRSAADLTPFVEAADSDFGLFIFEVLRDPDRMARVAARVKAVRERCQ